MNDAAPIGRERRFQLQGVRIDEPERRCVEIEWSDGSTASLDVLWLRDNCPSGGSKLSALRSFSIVDLALDLVIAEASIGTDGELEVGFSDGHHSRFDPAWLRPDRGRARRSLGDQVHLWRAGVDLPATTFDALGDDDGHLALLEALVSHGAAVVSEVPTGAAGTEALAACLGYVRETDFGRLFDIVSEPDVWELSQSTEALAPHTDDPYRYTPSGASILHCVEASPAGGGRSTLVDGFAVAESLRNDEPESFGLLSTVALPWVRYRATDVDQGAAVNLRADAPVIKLDSDGDVCGVRFHERSLGTLDLDSAVMHEVYRALIQFARRVGSAEFQWEHGLRTGEALVFDNQRVLHGRTAFTPPTADGDRVVGRRHLRLCTVDRGHAHSNLRLLRERAGTGTELDKLPAGNLS